MAWLLRGLREGIVTTAYPRRPDGYGANFRGAVSVPETGEGGPERSASVEALCPTGAIALDGASPTVDRGRCILCGRCVEQRPELFRFDPSVETATLRRHALVVPDHGDQGDEGDRALEEARERLGGAVRALRRSLHIRHVDSGSDGATEWEVNALSNPVYDVHRLGIFFTASPRHADLLLVSGAGVAGMAGALRRTYEAMPEPKLVMAAGTDAISGLGWPEPPGAPGTRLRGGYTQARGVAAVLPVDVWVPGSPPSPFSLLQGILLVIGLLREPVPQGSGPARGRGAP